MGRVRQLEYYRIAEESSWGEEPSTGDYVGFAPDEYDIDVENQIEQNEGRTLTKVDDFFLDVYYQMLRGSITEQAQPDNIERLLQMSGLSREDTELKSWSIQAYDAAKAEHILHSGLLADKVNISAGGSRPKLLFTFTLMGKGETTVASFTKPTLSTQVSYEFSDSVATFDSDIETNILDFSINLDNEVTQSEARDATTKQPIWMHAERKRVEITFSVRTDSSLAQHYRSLLRDRTPLSLLLNFSHPTLSAELNFTIPELTLASAERSGRPGDIQIIECSAHIKAESLSTDSISASV